MGRWGGVPSRRLTRSWSPPPRPRSLRRWRSSSRPEAGWSSPWVIARDRVSPWWSAGTMRSPPARSATSASSPCSANSVSHNERGMLNQFFHWLADTVLALGYPGIVLLMAIESSVLPLPSELVMPPAGYLAAKGHMNGWIAVAAGTVGSVLGALVNYALAVFVGEPVLRRYGKYILLSPR